MRGLTIPDLDEDFTADPVELYFDLAFVFAFSQLVSFLVHEHSFSGIWKSTLIFALMWLAWSNFTWAANATSSGSRVIRTLFLIATVATVPMAASVQAAFDDGGPAFSFGWAVISLMATGGYLAAIETGSTAWRSMAQMAVPIVSSIALVIVGAFVSGGPRIWMWLAAVAVVTYGTVRAGDNEWIVRVGHFAERHALIVIVALGEVIVAVGLPVVRRLTTGDGPRGLSLDTSVALAASGVFAALLWWAYFDRAAPALEHRAKDETGVRLGNYVRDVYTYSHVPIVFGIILAAASLEEITLHPADALPSVFRWMLALGLMGFLAGVGIAVFRAYRVVARERVVAAAVLVCLLAFAQSMSGLVLLLLIDLVLAVTLITEHLRIEGPHAEHAESEAVAA